MSAVVIDFSSRRPFRHQEAESPEPTSPENRQEMPPRNRRGWFLIADREALERVLTGLADEWQLSAKEAAFCRHLLVCLGRYPSFALSPKQVIWLTDIVADTDGEFSWSEGEAIRAAIDREEARDGA